MPTLRQLALDAIDQGVAETIRQRFGILAQGGYAVPGKLMTSDQFAHGLPNVARAYTDARAAVMAAFTVAANG